MEDAVEALIADHGGDPKAAMRALLGVNAELEARLAVVVSAVSYGFDRGLHHRRAAE